MSDAPATRPESAMAELTAAICAVMDAVEAVEKTGRNTDQGYSYASDADLLNALRPAMIEHGLALVPTVCQVTVSEHGLSRAGNKQWRSDVVQAFLLLHKSGGAVTVQTAGCGVDGQDKGVYKALTGALKYALRQTFLVPTGDDAEYVEPEPEPSQAFVRAMARLKGASPQHADQWREAKRFAAAQKKHMTEEEIEKVREYIGTKEANNAPVQG